MLRSILLGGALAAAAAVPSPAHANASDICVKVTITGVVNETVAPRCIPWGPGVTCGTMNTGYPPTLNVVLYTCTPSGLTIS